MVGSATPLSPEQHSALSAAIREAEARTSGEIYVVVARQSDSYFYPAALAVAAGVLLLAVAASFLLEHMWMTMRLPAFALLQAAVFLTGLGLVATLPGLRIRLVPRALRQRRASQNAARQFLAHNVHATQARTGVLIFVSLAERYAEIVADEGVASHVTQAEWDGLVSALTARAAKGDLSEGLEEAIGAAGNLLARHFPRSGARRNELDDHVVEL